MSQSYQKPLPTIDVWNKPFWEAAKAHRFVLQSCSSCGGFRFPPGPVCPHCLSDHAEWVEASGYGTVVSWIVFHQLYYQGFKDNLPYTVAVVQLDEGPRMFTNLVGVDEVEMGMRVKVTFDDVTEDFSLPKFTRAITV